MNQQEALHAIAAHHDHETAKHNTWTSPSQGTNLMQARLTKLIQDTLKHGGQTSRALAARRALQLAGLCVRFVVDFKLKQDGPDPETE